MNIRIVAICLMLALCGCKKKGADPEYYLKYKVDGVAVDISTNGSNPSAYTSYIGGVAKQLKLTRSGEKGGVLQITLQDAALTGGVYAGGTYQLTKIDTCGGNASLHYNGGSKDYLTICGSTGSMQLLYDANKKELRGTFSAYVPAMDSTNSIKGVNITDGELYLLWAQP
jgi:hypothetical protein